MLFIMILSPNLLGPEQENSDNYIQKTLKGGYNLMKSPIHTPQEKERISVLN